MSPTSNTFNTYESKLKRKAVLLIKERCVTFTFLNVRDIDHVSSLDQFPGSVFIGVIVSISKQDYHISFEGEELTSKLKIITYCNFFSSHQENYRFLPVKFQRMHCGKPLLKAFKFN